jgi:hypothetical protein
MCKFFELIGFSSATARTSVFFCLAIVARFEFQYGVPIFLCHKTSLHILGVGVYRASRRRHRELSPTTTVVLSKTIVAVW